MAAPARELELFEMRAMEVTETGCADATGSLASRPGGGLQVAGNNAAPMHILQMIDDFRTAGTSAFICDLSAVLKARGHRVTLLTVRSQEHNEAGLIEKMKHIGVEIIDLGWTSKRAYDVVDYARAALRARSAIKSLKPDVIHLHAYFAEQAVNLAFPFAKLPIVITIATDTLTFDSHSWRHLFRDSLASRLYKRKSVRMVTRTHYLTARIRKRMRLGDKPVECIWNGLPRAWFLPAANGLKDIDVVVAGRADGNKNHITIVRALAELKARGRAVTAVIAGDGPRFEAFQSECVKLGLTDTVSCPGQVHNIRELFDHAKIVACPSIYEGFSRTPIEGLARGCACICSDIPSHREILDSGRYGVLLDPMDPARWADAIAELLDNDERREALARAGGTWVKDNFQFEPLAERYIRLYEVMKMTSKGDF